jgi:CRISPR-associated protein Cas5t
VAAFRDPFVVVGHIPTAPCPPPSTVFGLCTAAFGARPDPRTFFVGIHAQWRALAQDVETHHPAELVDGRAKMTTGDGRKWPKRIESQPNAVRRDFLFDVELCLYLPLEVGSAFRAPVWPMLLGRSQDLAEVIEVREVTLVRKNELVLGHSVLPVASRSLVQRGAVLALSRTIGEGLDRPATFDRYVFGRSWELVVLDERIDRWPVDARDALYVDEDAALVEWEGEEHPRGVWLLSKVGQS